MLPCLLNGPAEQLFDELTTAEKQTFEEQKQDAETMDKGTNAATTREEGVKATVITAENMDTSKRNAGINKKTIKRLTVGEREEILQQEETREVNSSTIPTQEDSSVEISTTLE
uniref:Uncharacterized protein n=1 Tax=Plectus sambesii TaxID=2011161 RepID=A0A914UKZ2_9BILA